MKPTSQLSKEPVQLNRDGVNEFLGWEVLTFLNPKLFLHFWISLHVWMAWRSFSNLVGLSTITEQSSIPKGIKSSPATSFDPDKNHLYNSLACGINYAYFENVVNSTSYYLIDQSPYTSFINSSCICILA